jgi:hypothetical protein
VNDTPETDGHLRRNTGNGSEWVRADFARKLEQERDQAQRELQQLLESIKVTEVSIQMVDGIARPIPWAGDGEEWRMCAEKAGRERDEAIQQAGRDANRADANAAECSKWRGCAQRLVQAAKAYARNFDLPRGVIEAEEAIAEFDRLEENK